MTSRVSPKAVALVLLLLLVPRLPGVSFSILGNINTAAQYALVAISLVILTGWSGNISLGQAAFMGVGAYVSGLVLQGWNIPFPINMLWAAAAGAAIAVVFGMFALRIRGLYLAVATLIFSWLADAFLFRQEWFTRAAAVEVPALGREGTFPYFDWTQRSTFYYASWATVVIVILMVSNVRDSKTGRALFAVRGSEVAAASLGIDVVRTKLTAFAVSGAIAALAGNLAIIGAQVVTQDQFSVSKSLFYLSVAVVGGLSSLGGAVAAALLFAGIDELFLRVEAFAGWLEVVPAVLLTLTLLLFRGGLAAIPEAVGRLLRPYQDRIDRVTGPAVALAEKARLLAVAAARKVITGSTPDKLSERAPAAPKASPIDRFLEGFAGGRFARKKAARTEPPLDLFEIEVEGDARAAGDETDPSTWQDLAIAADLEPAVLERNGSEPHPDEEEADSPAAGDDETPAPRFTFAAREVILPPTREERRPVIEARNITVKFGGLTAVNDYSLTVREGEIVGLIGPNGAGKTTLFNSIAGLNVPTRGEVHIFGQDVTELAVHQRALLGVGRTFQAIQLFAQLSVFENLLVATHQHNPTGLSSHVFVTGRAFAAEKQARAQVQRAIDLLDLRDVAHRRVGDLPFGVLRMVEVARALVTGARAIMLDEPASGLDGGETDRLSDILRFVRSLGVTLLLIEHDVPMVTSVSDYMYVIERGTFLAEGTPDEIKRNQRVIAAYLGESFAEDQDAEPATAPVSL